MRQNGDLILKLGYYLIKTILGVKHMEQKNCGVNTQNWVLYKQNGNLNTCSSTSDID